MIPQQQSTQYYTTIGVGDPAFRDGVLGAAPRPLLLEISPVYNAIQSMQRRSLTGLGDDASAGMATLAAAAVVGIVANGVFSYFVGKAMAPKGDETAWGVTSAFVGPLFGPIGLGVMGLFSLHKQK